MMEKAEIIEIFGKTYRVTGFETVCFGCGEEFKIAKADFLYKGKWVQVKNVQILKELYKKLGG